MFNISVVDFQKLTGDISIIDIRSKEKFNDNHIPGARNIEFESLILRPEQYIKKEETYYIYCQKGKISMEVCQILNRQGYHTINIIGGYEAWIMKS